MKKLAIITGASGFLAKNVINVLEQSCDKIYLVDIENKKEKNNNEKFFDAQLDVTNETDVKNFFQNLEFNKFSSSVLVNMAAVDYKVTNSGANFKWNMKNADITLMKKGLEVSLIGTFLMSKYFCEESIQNGHNSNILNFASDLSILISDDSVYGDNDTHKPIDYAISKHGLIGLTKYFSVYYAKNNIRVNAISPSGVKNNQNDEFIVNYSKLTPMNRMLEASEIESAVEFLISEKSSYVTGQNLIIDGGKSIW